MFMLQYAKEGTEKKSFDSYYFLMISPERCRVASRRNLATLLKFLDHLDHGDGHFLPILADHGACDWVHPCLRLSWLRDFVPLFVAAQLKARLHPVWFLSNCFCLLSHHGHNAKDHTLRNVLALRLYRFI